MDERQRATRRRILLGAMAGLGGILLGGVRRFLGFAAADEPLGLTPQAYLPLVSRNYPEPTPTPTATPTDTPTPRPTFPPPQNARVVHVHDPRATSWGFSGGWYGEYVDQEVVDEMVGEGLKALTGTSDEVSAWRTLLPDYQPGQTIAIKVNFNNSSCADPDNQIDALAEPVNGLIATLRKFGVAEQDIWIFDALRAIPDRFVRRLRYPNVRLFDSGLKGCWERATFTSNDPHAQVDFGHPNLANRRLTDVVVEADYLINVPIMKDHGICGVTLGFKNHFGTIDRVVGGGADNLHDYIDPDDPLYRSDYSPLVDIYLNPHIGGKTVLVLGDGLYGALGNTNAVPSRWSTFGNDAPNSLLFATDPVAVDCVMLDLLDAEPGYHPKRSGADDYLRVAASSGLGTFERGDPWQHPYGSGYSGIEYVRLEL